MRMRWMGAAPSSTPTFWDIVLVAMVLACGGGRRRARAHGECSGRGGLGMAWMRGCGGGRRAARLACMPARPPTPTRTLSAGPRRTLAGGSKQLTETRQGLNC